MDGTAIACGCWAMAIPGILMGAAAAMAIDGPVRGASSRAATGAVVVTILGLPPLPCPWWACRSAGKSSKSSSSSMSSNLTCFFSGLPPPPPCPPWPWPPPPPPWPPWPWPPPPPPCPPWPWPLLWPLLPFPGLGGLAPSLWFPPPPTTWMSVMTLPALEVSLSPTSSASKGPDTVTVLLFSS
uniref:Uncharacterized protein n=1 Tax=Arundo donax TaxID=35708 RepID=A0A0A9ASN0_ARUDO